MYYICIVIKNHENFTTMTNQSRTFKLGEYDEFVAEAERIISREESTDSDEILEIIDNYESGLNTRNECLYMILSELFFPTNKS